MPREVSDQEWAEIEQARAIAKAASEVWDDPQLGPAAKELFKRKNPKVAIPDHDIRSEMRAGFAEIKQQREEEKTAERQAKEDDYWKTERARVKSEFGVTDDGMKDMEKFMLENHVGSYEVAAGYLAAAAIGWLLFAATHASQISQSCRIPG